MVATDVGKKSSEQRGRDLVDDALREEIWLLTDVVACLGDYSTRLTSDQVDELLALGTGSRAAHDLADPRQAGGSL
jgi:hypothetical protein